MTTFPLEFEDLLNKKGKTILNQKNGFSEFTDKQKTPIIILNDIFEKKYASPLVHLLNSHFYNSLKNAQAKISPDDLNKMKKNYSERLSKNLKFKSLEIGKQASRSYKIAHQIGLVQMLQSVSFQKFGEAVIGKVFGTVENNQLICYESGDYVSPHNDHHPENKEIKNGYLDMHLMFANSHVKHQLLVYENNGFLNQYADISNPMAIAIYKLPFWHYTTPLIAKKGKETEARRWLILRSFQMVK